MLIRSPRLAGSLLLAGIFLAVLAAGTRLPAHAQTAGPGHTATIAFADDRALTLDPAVIAKHPSFSVEVLNVDPRNAQTISLTLTGSPAAGRTLLALLSKRPGPQQAPPLGAATFTFPLAVTDGTPGGVYPGVLIALDNQGDLLRRTVTLTLPAAAAPALPLPTPAPTVTYPVVTADRDAFTLTGLNYYPSLINPLRPFAGWLGVLLLSVAAWSFIRARLLGSRKMPPPLGAAGEAGRAGAALAGSSGEDVPTNAAPAAGNGTAGEDPAGQDATTGAGGPAGRTLILLLGILALTYGAGAWGVAATPHAVVVAPIHLFPAPSAGPQASLVSDKGSDTGALVYENGALTAQGLPRAGTYSGKLGEKGPKVTVNVADWWPYAALTLCLGVLLAFTIGRYYTNTRPARAARVLAAQVGHEIASTESDWQRKHAGAPLGGYSMAGLARDWVGWALRSLEAGDAGAATAHLNNLDPYAEAYRAFLQHLERLASAVAAVEKKTADDQAAALATARALLKGQDLPFDPSLSQKPDLKERETALAAELEAKDKEVGAAIKALAPYEAQMLREILPQGLPREQQAILPLSLVWQDLGPLTQGPYDPDDLFRFSLELPAALAAGPAQLRWDFGDGTSSEPFKAATTGVQTDHCFALGGPRTVRLLLVADAGGYPAGTLIALTQPPVPVTSGLGRAALSRETFRLNDVQMTLVSGLIAIGTGLSVLYFTVNAWGSPADYLAALLWGSIGTQGVKSVAGLVQNRWLGAS